MKIRLIYLFLALPATVWAAQTENADSTVYDRSRNFLLTQGYPVAESHYYEGINLVSGTNVKFFDKLVEIGLKLDIDSLDLENTPADELARIGLLQFAYGNDLQLAQKINYAAAMKGNAVSANLLGVIMQRLGKNDVAETCINAALANHYYLPALHNKVIISIINNPTPNNDKSKAIIKQADHYFDMLALICDPTDKNSYPNYSLMEFITLGDNKDSLSKRRSYLRGDKLIEYIRTIVPDYEPPVKLRAK